MEPINLGSRRSMPNTTPSVTSLAARFRMIAATIPFSSTSTSSTSRPCALHPFVKPHQTILLAVSISDTEVLPEVDVRATYTGPNATIDPAGVETICSCRQLVRIFLQRVHNGGSSTGGLCNRHRLGGWLVRFRIYALFSQREINGVNI